MESLIVGEPRHFDDYGSLVVSAPIVIGGQHHEVQYRLADGPVASGAETFLAAALVPAMKVGTNLHILGQISPRLLAAIPKIQEILHTWYPYLQKVTVEVEAQEPHPSIPAAGVGCFFSGGVDSFYTLLQHREEITKLIFVHGFDIRLDDEPLRSKVSAVLRTVASEFRKPLIEVETNLRAFSEPYAGWGSLYHGCALATVALLLSPQLRKVYIPASYSYSQMHPWGSHPLLDPLWSTNETEIVHDGCEALRIEKVARISSCDVALRSLRSCWENPGGAYNCGRCKKCLLTKVLLRAVGALDRCTTFEGTVDLKAVSRLPPSHVPSTTINPQTLEILERLGKDPALARALRDCLNQRYHRGIWRLVRGARAWFRGLVGRFGSASSEFGLPRSGP